MQEFWQWAGNFWWLIFPLMGMAGGVANAWERRARRRHKQRLETLRLKTELKQAEIEARGLARGDRHRRAQPAVDAPDAVTSAQLLTKLFSEHDEITARWLDYELDVAKLIAFPAMSDGRQPLTAAFLRAKKTADTLRPDSADARISDAAVAEYLEAVGNYAVAFDIAERDARRLRNSTFSEDERKRLDRAQQLLKVALDDSATRAERQVAYKRVRDELDGLIDLSDDAVQVLEKKIAGEITPGRAPVADPLPATDPLPAERPTAPRPQAVYRPPPAPGADDER